MLTVSEEEMQNAVTKKTDLKGAVVALQAVVRMKASLKRARQRIQERQVRQEESEPPDVMERAARKSALLQTGNI